MVAGVSAFRRESPGRTRRPHPPLASPRLLDASSLLVRASPWSDARKRARTIVCGVDANEAAREVLRVAGELSKRLTARLVLVHVAPDVAVPGASSAPGAEDELKVVEAERAHRLLDELADLEQLEAPVERRVAFGSPGPALEAVARRERADLIVVGSRGRGALASSVLGSVSSHLSRSAPCPVVVVPPRDAAPPDESRSGRRIVSAYRDDNAEFGRRRRRKSYG